MLLGAGRAEHAVALVLAVAVEVALVLVADADVALEVDVVVLCRMDRCAEICCEMDFPSYNVLI